MGFAHSVWDICSGTHNPEAEVSVLRSNTQPCLMYFSSQHSLKPFALLSLLLKMNETGPEEKAKKVLGSIELELLHLPAASPARPLQTVILHHSDLPLSDLTSHSCIFFLYHSCYHPWFRVIWEWGLRVGHLLIPQNISFHLISLPDM